MNFLLSLFIFTKIWQTTAPAQVNIYLEIEALRTYEVQTEQGTFVRLDIAESGMSANVGHPLLPVIKKLVAIPEDAEIELEVSVLEAAESLDYPIIPVQPPVPKIPGARAEFTIDKEFYSQDTFGPQEWAEIVGTGYIRGHRVAILKIYPMRYNPQRGKIIYCKDLKVTLRILHPNIAKTQQILSRYASPPFEALTSRIIMNYGAFGKVVPSLPIGYLVICADDFYDEVLPLAEWKFRKGFKTQITRASEIPGGATAGNISDYIQDAYDNWLVPPTYVLLVGDVNTIPTFTGGGSGSATDLYFTTMAGKDYFPDIEIGRLSVANATQCSTIVERIVDYERTQWGGGDEWTERAYFMASNDGGHHQVAESTHAYCTRLWRLNGGQCDSLWWFYETGTPIDSAINDGRGVVVYSGHGGTTNWVSPEFYQSDVQALTNVDMYPLVCSHACFTGRFSDAECFGETWIRVPDGGACAFWGGSSSTYWEMDDTLQRAMFRGLLTDSLTWLSGMMDRAKYKLYETWGPSGDPDEVSTLYYYEVYNLLGDPSMQLFTLIPESLEVSHPSEVLVGKHSLEVSTNVAEALVCAAINDTNFAGYTDAGGDVTLEIETAESCTVWITVTAYNFSPYEGFALAKQGVSEGVAKWRTGLYQLAPNPFNRRVAIEYRVGSPGKVVLQIFDVTGRSVKVLVDEAAKPGSYITYWDGADGRGKGVKSGVYFLRSEIASHQQTHKIIILR